MINREAPFPQANDMEKVLKILNIDDEQRLKNVKEMQIYLGDISDRQVGYYIAACTYLGILERETKHFTEIGNKLRKIPGVEQDAAVAQIIVSDEPFGRVYFTERMSGCRMSIEEVMDILSEYISFSDVPMYRRRASTIVSWVNWIIEKENGMF